MKKLRLFLVILSSILPLSILACAESGTPWELTNIFLLERPLNDKGGYERYYNSSFDESTEFWYNYIGGNISKSELEDAIIQLDVEDFDNQDTTNALLLYLKGHHDKTAIDFLLCNTKLLNMAKWANSWTYQEAPSSQEYAALYKEICAIRANQALADRVTFLKMRCLYAMKNYDECLSLWDSIRDMPSSGLRNRMYGYVGGIYYRQHNYEKALEIFYQQGDNQSIHRCVDALMDKGGIEYLYTHDANSLTLRYVAQDYANYYYHYMRSVEAFKAFDAIVDMKEGGPWERVNRDYAEVLAIAMRIAVNSQTKDKMFWNAFIGFMQWVHGDADSAYEYLCKAESIGGKQSMLSNVRSLKILAALAMNNKPANLDDMFIAEFHRLYQSSKANKLKFEASDEYPQIEYYSEADWTIYSHELFEAVKKHYAANGCIPLLIDCINYHTNCNYYEYSASAFASHLDSYYDSNDIIGLLHSIESGTDDKVERELLDIATGDNIVSKDMLNELIGTRLIRTQDFEGAKQYLSKVSVRYINTLSIAPYLALRTMPQLPFVRKDKSDLSDKSVTLQSNVKLEYVENVLQLKSRINTLNGEQKAQAAYELANMLFQATPSGDLWAIADYQWSCYTPNNDLTRPAVDMLHLALRNTKSQNLRKKIYFALASIPADQDHQIAWDYDTKRWSFASIASWQREGYNGLRTLVSAGDPLCKSCDALRDYTSSLFPEKDTNIVKGK